jgi:hypothetical protein
MSDPYSALQPVIRTALVDSAAVGALVGDRIYDRVPSNPTFPYLRLNITDLVEDDDGCGKHWIANVEVHVWSRAAGRKEASLIAGPVRDALDAITAVTGYRINHNQYRTTRMLDDPDGLSTHGIVTQEIALAAT